MSDKRSCHYCGTTDADLRPYGPEGAFVCFDCATATEERERQAENAYGALLDGAEAAGGGVVTVGLEEGPQPGVHGSADPGATP